MHAPRTNHLAIVHRNLKYLIGALWQGILHKSHRLVKAKVYANVDWVGSKTNRMSSMGYAL